MKHFFKKQIKHIGQNNLILTPFFICKCLKGLVKSFALHESASCWFNCIQPPFKVSVPLRTPVDAEMSFTHPRNPKAGIVAHELL